MKNGHNDKVLELVQKFKEEALVPMKVSMGRIIWTKLPQRTPSHLCVGAASMFIISSIRR